MSLNGNPFGGQCPSNPPTLRDKLFAGGGLILVAWLCAWWAFYAAAPIVILIASVFATILTAALGFSILEDVWRVKR